MMSFIKKLKKLTALPMLLLIMGMLLMLVHCDRQVMTTEPGTGNTNGGSGNTNGGGSSSITTISSSANPALYVSAIGVFFGATPPYADETKQWIEITIRDASALPPRWRLNNARENTANIDFNTIIDSSLFTWDLQDGDVIRTHPGDWSPSQDSAKSDNNSDKWDYKTGSTFGFDSRSGFLYIIDGSNVIHDVAVYANGNNDISVTGDARQALTASVDGGLWPSANKSDAIDIGNTAVNYAQLTDSSMHANARTSWVITNLGGGGGGGNENTNAITTISSNATPSIHISAIGVFFGSTPSYADGDNQWVEVTIKDASALPSNWRLASAGRPNSPVDFNTIIDSASFTWTLADGDVIRTHPSSWPYNQDTAKSDNNPAKWDYKTGSIFGFDSRNGFLYIIDGSNVIHDVMIYANGSETVSLTPNAIAVLTNVVASGLWPSENKSDALDIGDTAMNFARLTDTSVHANASNGWETVTYTTPPDFLIINEINSEGGFGTNSSNSDFVELYNSNASAFNIASNRWYMGKGNANYQPMNFTNLPTNSVPANGFYLATFGGSAPDMVGSITRDVIIPTQLGSDDAVSIYYRQDDGWFSEKASQGYTGYSNSWGRFPDGGAIDTHGNQTPTPGSSNVDAPPPPPPPGQIHQESFETTNGWTLSHTFNDDGNDFAGRFMTGSTPGDINTAMETQVNGSYYIAMEDTMNGDGGDPSDGVVTLTLDAVTVTDKTNLRLSMLLAALDSDTYDFHSQNNGDRVEISATIDSGTASRIGFFTADMSTNNRPIHQYTNGDNNNIGTLGAKMLEAGQVYEFPISGTGDSLVINIKVRMDAGREAVLIDNLRILGD